MQALTRNLFRPFSLSLGLTAIVLGIFFGLQMQRQVAATVLQAEETITADITKDTTWVKGTTYFLNKETKAGDKDKATIVQKGATLTIEAGAIIKGIPDTTPPNNLGAKLQVEGRLVALGTATDPVIFTSQKDSGSTQWSGIVFEGGTGLLRNVIVRNSGFRNGAETLDQKTPGTGILINNVQKGEVRIEQSQIVSTSVKGPNLVVSRVPDYGIYALNSNFVISETKFIKNFDSQEVDYPIFITGTSNFTLTGNNLAYAADPRGLTSLIALGGPNSSTLRPQQGSQGYLIKSGFNVPKGKKLLIEPGVQILAEASNTEFNVKGNLEAIGSPTKPITFDAALSGTIWAGLVFDGGTGNLGYVKVRNGGAPSSISIPEDSLKTKVAQGDVIINKGQVRLENSQITNARSDAIAKNFISTVAGIYVQDGQAVISQTKVGNVGNTFGSTLNNGSGLLVAGTSAVTLTDSSEITNPLSSGISVLGGQVVVANRSKVWQNALTGIVAKGGKTIVDCAYISDNNKGSAATDGGISIADPATLTIIGSTIAGNKTSGLNSTSATTITAEYNWWGKDTGPTNTKLNPKGTGDKISDKVDALPFLKKEQCVATLATSFQGPKELAAGAPFTYTVLAENKGLSRASSITTTITLPSSTSFKSAPANCKQDSGDPQKVICNVASLNPLEIANLAIVGTTKVGTLGVITFTNAITGADFILNTGQPAQYTPIVKDMADLSIGIKPSQAKVEPGNVVTYTVTITNQRIPAENVLITTTLPLSGTYASASKDCKKDSKNKLLLTCQLGTIKVETKQITFSVKISATISGLNVAKVQIGSSTPDLNASNNQNETKITITVKPKVVPVTPTEPPRLYMPLILRQPPEPTPTLTPIVTPTPISGTGDLTKTLVLRR